MRAAFIILILFTHLVKAQDPGFSFGAVTLNDLTMKRYPADTTASAVVLDEFGDANLDAKTHEITFRYHARIKILDRSSYGRANFSIPIRKRDNRVETVYEIRASVFNLEGTQKRESKMNMNAVLTEKYNEFIDFKKFTLPDVHEGSVLEVSYSIQSPFIFNFWPWEFQSDIPKVKSEFWSVIPGNFYYHIRLRGFLQLSRNEASVLDDCFVSGISKVDCAVNKFAITNIPAFKEEEYMTAASNFKSSVNFELAEVNYLNGRIDKFTKEWRDVDEELKFHEDFGLQIKKGRNAVGEEIKLIIAGKSAPLDQAKAIYRYITQNYRWDGSLGKYALGGTKKVLESKAGNAGDINLLLIAALQAGGLRTDPVILSTRENGLPTELHPVLSNFNYVVAQVDIGGTKYLLDATEKFRAFGLLPERCLNGKGRVIGDESGWIEIKPTDRQKEVKYLELRLDSTGRFRGSISITYAGYDAAAQRKEIYSFSDQKEYLTSLKKGWKSIAVEGYEVKDLENFDIPFTETFKVSIDGFENLNVDRLYLNPFIVDRQSDNPFKTVERIFPVDFGAPIDKTLILNLQFPDGFKLEDMPAPTASTLPNKGGKFLFNTARVGNKLSVTSNISLTKSVYTADEYPYLRELFNRLIAAQQSVLVFSKN